MREVMDQQQQQANQLGTTMPNVRMVFRTDRQTDTRRYNAPTANEVAMVFVSADGEPPMERDIVVYRRNPRNNQYALLNIKITDPNLDPMTYAIFFPYGEPGWQPALETEHYLSARERGRQRVTVTLLQWRSAQFSVRDEFNPILNAGKLTQQFMVDAYTQIEASRLLFNRLNQTRLRASEYQGLMDYMQTAAEAAGVRAGVPVILPSSFEGSPRNMHEKCQDAMAIFSRFGAPDLFITFTANPNWKEIQQNIGAGNKVGDRSDIVVRVFNLKLKELLNDLTRVGIFGKCIAWVYTIEFQKRGLPHAHILLTLETPYKFRSGKKLYFHIHWNIFE